MTHHTHLQVRAVVDSIAGSSALGPHYTFELENGTIYTVSCPYVNAVKVRFQVTDEIWYRMDGGDPAINRGFQIGRKGRGGEVMHTEDVIICGSNMRLVTFRDRVILQGQWLGFEE